MAQSFRVEDKLRTSGAAPRMATEPSLAELLKSLLAQTGELVRSEADVIKLEMQESTRAMIIDGIKAAIFAGIALLGVVSLVAFLIIGLGDLLTRGAYEVQGFWLSALIIGVVLTVGGGLLAVRHAQHIGRDVRFARTKIGLRTDKALLKDGIEKLKEASTP